ncbi:hypothetical protein PHISCL_07740 [Aspergillus sclerotialis]|uniref:Autophagy-related protein 101 n=1 Tax=Aspergillus sclerotialis TaxID=2070753 RepID=A0A3A2ZKM4_9EURO|nr:hypothetical protein PHISCL_07740 [Aspergillus sclerotialis]
MEPRKTPPEYFLEIFADTSSVRDVLKGVLNLIFFHRYFPSIRPTTIDVLDLTLPAINDVNLETLIDSRVSTLVRQHLSSSAGGGGLGGVGVGPGGVGTGGVRGRIAVEFYEKRRRRSGIWFSGLAGKTGEEEVCWEIWTLHVTMLRRGRSLVRPIHPLDCRVGVVCLKELSMLMVSAALERTKVRKAMENMLQKAALKILTVVNRDKDHIPPITTSDSNPFPYRIVLNPRADSWQNRLGLH